jgi:hypothetical protein
MLNLTAQINNFEKSLFSLVDNLAVIGSFNYESIEVDSINGVITLRDKSKNITSQFYRITEIRERD